LLVFARYADGAAIIDIDNIFRHAVFFDTFAVMMPVLRRLRYYIERCRRHAATLLLMPHCLIHY